VDELITELGIDDSMTVLVAHELEDLKMITRGYVNSMWKSGEINNWKTLVELKVILTWSDVLNLL
jgi:hypothetical protein